MKDTISDNELLARIEAIRQRAIGAGDADRIAELRRDVSAAGKATALAAVAAGNMAGLQGTGAALATAQADQKAAMGELHRAQRRIADAGKASLPEFAALALELGEAAAALAVAMRDAKAHVSNLAGVQLGQLNDLWPPIDASARNLLAIAREIDPARPAPRQVILRVRGAW
jgi:hypothetical protein